MIRNDRFAVGFDARTGTFSVHRADGTALLDGAAACANADAGKESTASPGREHSLGSQPITDRLGSGRRLTVHSRDPRKRVDLRIEVTLYDERPLVAFEVHCTNVSASDVRIASLEPLRALSSERGALRVPGVSTCLTNGEMYYDAGRVHAFGAEPPPGARPPMKGVRLANDSVAAAHPTVGSWWNLGLFGGYDREGTVLGFIENTRSLGLLLAAKTADGEIAFVAESVFAPAIVLRPGESIGSNRVALCVGSSPYAALEDYAAAVGSAQNARTSSIVNGWCSWFYTLAEVSEREVLVNAAFAAKHLKPHGLEYIQIDEGFQRAHGDWEGNERFPSGMRSLAERIKEHGLKAGLWLSPYVISERAALFREHPEWLVTRRDGSLQRIGNWENESSPEAQSETIKRYCLDVTHPGAAEWLHGVVATIVHGWGYEMLKLDFMAWSILAAERFHDPAVSSAAAYRRGLEIVRAAAGERCHILECGPGNTTVGLIDSMRIEADIYYGYAAAAWRQYFQDPSSSLAAAAKRYYFHRRTWVNDNEHVCIDLLPRSQAEAAATSIAIAGGNTISGDRLVDLDPAKLEILKKILPSSGEAATPVDLLDADIPTAFVLRVTRPFASWSVVALFNPDLDAAIERRFPLARLGLDASETYVAFDFWKQKLVGEVRGELAAKVDAGGVTLLALHAKTGAPQLLSTSRHVTQGAVEIEDVRWDAAARRLSGVSLGGAHSSHDVFVYLPDARPWTWGGRHVLLRDREGYTLKLVDANVLRVHVRFESGTRVPWRIDVDEFLG